MSQTAKFALLLALGLLLLAETGCTKPGMDAKTVAMHRTRLSLAEEPDGVQTVSDVRSTLLGESADVHDDHDDHDGDHDHDGDGHPDHAAADHDAEEDEHAGHDHDGDDHADHADHAATDHDAEEDEHEGHDHDSDGHADHEAADHDEDGDDHDGHDHEAHTAHTADDHDHDGDGQPDHAPHEHVHATEPQAVTVVGHIGGLANPWAGVHKEYPFAKSQAVFFLADPQAVVENEEAGHVHAPGEECAFCAAHAADQADMIALVQLVDEQGKVLPLDARELFDVKEKDTVVVKGQARVTEGGILVVNAQGLYIRK